MPGRLVLAAAEEEGGLAACYCEFGRVGGMDVLGCKGEYWGEADG